MFLENGRYSLTIMRSDLPKFAANNRTQGTADENKATVAGMITHFGRYTATADSFTYIVEASSFPNWNGTEQKRAMKISGDELQYTNPAPSGGGAPATLVWKRVK